MSSSPPPSFSDLGPVPARPELPDGAPEPPAAPASTLAAVPAWSPFVALLAVVVLATTAAVVIGTALGADLEENPPEVAIPSTLVQDVLFIAVAFAGAALFVRGRLLPSALGIRTTRLGPALGWSALAVVAFYAFALIFQAVAGKAPEQDLVSELRGEDSLAVLVGYGALVSVGAPLAEETFFRGFMFGVLREKLPLWGAALIAGGVFGIAHAFGSPVRTLVVLVWLGVLFCLLYWRTGSLLPGMSLHAIINSSAFAGTKELSLGSGALVVVGSVIVVLLVAFTVIAWERRLS